MAVPQDQTAIPTHEGNRNEEVAKDDQLPLMLDGQKPDEFAQEEQLPLILGTLQQNEPIAPSQISPNLTDRNPDSGDPEAVRQPPIPHPDVGDAINPDVDEADIGGALVNPDMVEADAYPSADTIVNPDMDEADAYPNVDAAAASPDGDEAFLRSETKETTAHTDSFGAAEELDASKPVAHSDVNEPVEHQGASQLGERPDMNEALPHSYLGNAVPQSYVHEAGPHSDQEEAFPRSDVSEASCVDAKVTKVVNGLLTNPNEPSKEAFESAVRAELLNETPRRSVITDSSEKIEQLQKLPSNTQTNRWLAGLDLVVPTTCTAVLFVFVVLFLSVFITLERRLAKGEFAAQDFSDL